MTRELAVRIDQPLEFKPSDIIAQVSKIQAVMRASMRKGIHYGNVIPGVDKPMLLKPGAEKLCLTFRFAPSYDIRRQDLEGGHREYEIVCTLRHQVTEMVLGQGVGSASTLESKWRFRWEICNARYRMLFGALEIPSCSADRILCRARMATANGGSIIASNMITRPITTTPFLKWPRSDLWLTVCSRVRPRLTFLRMNRRMKRRTSAPAMGECRLHRKRMALN